MNNISLTEDCSKQWELLLLLISSEEKKFDKTSENEIDMMAYFYKNDGVRKILHEWLRQMKESYARKISDSDTALKSEDISLLWRQRGNDKFRNNNMEESYACYSRSVLYAHHGGEMFPLALANRSATLLRLKRFQECLMDIKLALDSGYPNEQQHKLLLREADCYIELCETSKARESLANAISHAKSLKLSSKSGEFGSSIQILEKKLCLIDKKKQLVMSHEIPQCYLGENNQFVCASAALDLRYNDSVGRHVVTNRDMQRGDILFVEEPYAFVALPIDETLMSVVCENCCKSNINPVPCSVCSRSIYCGEICRRRAWHSFHHWECVGAQSRLWPTIGIAHLALRVLLITTSKGFPITNSSPEEVTLAADVYNIYSKLDKVDVYKNCNSPFFRIFNLVTNFDKMNNTDYIQYALTAVMLTVYLESFTNYFEELPSRLPYALSTEELQLLTASLLLRHMGQLVCNGHAVMALRDENSGGLRTVSEREVRLATAIYPSASMMNHSCDPNIINSFNKCKLIVRCTRELPEGAEVFNCYGPSRAREPAAHRRAQLRAQYLFNCTCAACSDPEKRDFVLLFGAYSCHVCKGPVLVGARRPQCQQCRSTELSLEKALSTLERADELIKNSESASNLEERCEKLVAALKMKQQVLHKHHTALRETADRLACLYAEIGDVSKSVELIKQNIPSLEYQFGSFSVEVAHELRKLADVMLERIITSPQHTDYRDWCLETHKIIKKALQLMELNYGAWEPMAERLREQEEFVAGLLAESRVSLSEDSIHNMLHYNLKI